MKREQLRIRLEAHIVRCIEILDALDDPDLEDTEIEIDPDFEPSLASLDRDNQIAWSQGGDQDLEQAA